MVNKNFYLEGASDKPAVLLLHSLGDSAEMMRSLAEKINAEGYAVYAPTFSGHTTSDFTDVFKADMIKWTADGDKFLQELKNKGHKDIVVAGLSLGGLIAADLIVKNRNLLGLVCIATPILGDIKDSKVTLYMRQKYFQTFSYAPTVEDRDASKHLFNRLDEILTGINQWMEDIYKELFTINVPVFIAQGLADEVINPKLAERFQRSLRSVKHLSFHTYSEGTHYLVKDPNLQQLAEDMLVFLHQLD